MAHAQVCFYVYYRIAPMHLATARTAVALLLHEVEARCGIRGRLMQRADDAQTWMEVYEGIADAPNFRAALDEISASSTLTGLLEPQSTRHVEHFQSFAPPEASD